MATSGRSTGPDDRRTVWLVCLVLAAITLAVFGRTVGFGFVNYDDDVFVYDVPAVANGLTADGVARAFTHGSLGFWDPLTTLSHMLDCQLYGLNAGGHHLTNVLLHTASVLLLFLALRRLTGALWPSAFVAALFAIHPLRVESVAWITERKDVLSGLFFMLTLGAYARYAEGPPKLSRYLMVVLWFVLGLMSKVMLVTLPAVLLLLDYWPLGRFEDLKRKGVGAWQAMQSRVILEKIPLLTLSAGACVVGVLAQRQSGTISSLESAPLSLRLANAVVSVAIYIRQMFWPTGLAVLYPYPVHAVAAGRVVLAMVLLAAISAVAIGCRRTRPYLLAGWLWYLVMLVPVIGLVQAGRQAHADRYTYLPQIGLYVAMTWLAGSWWPGWRHRREVLTGTAGLVIAALSVVAYNQTSCWQDSELLWRHALACTPDNALARNDLGLAVLQKGHEDEAEDEFQKAIAIEPDFFEPHNNLGLVLADQGRLEEAMTEFGRAIAIQPNRAEAHNNLGSALTDMGRKDDAMAEFRLAIKLRPDYAAAHNNLGRVLSQEGWLEESVAECEEALRLQPGLADARFNIGNVFNREGRVEDAIKQYQKAVELEPGFAGARYNLGMLLWRQGRTDEAMAQFQGTRMNPAVFGKARLALELIAWDLATSPDDAKRNGVKAVELAQQLSDASGGNPALLATLAAAYAETGRFADATAAAERAQELAVAQTNAPLAGAIQQQLAVYQSGRPFRDVVPTNAPAQK
jgi:tetratricopeptide (TPR) repeat protein